MSKRAAAAAVPVKPTKLAKKDDDVWSTIMDDEGETREFKPVEGGPKTKIQKTFVLNYKPKISVTISLNGCFPELRFTTPDGCFYMTGTEFLEMSGSERSGSSGMNLVRLENTEDDGYRLARYGQTESGMTHLLPCAVLDLNQYAAKRLKAKLDMMCDHVREVRENERVIRVMFECVKDVYKEEYKLMNTLIPMSEKFSELSRIVDTYVPQVLIVKAFIDKMYDNRWMSRYNHYNLASIVLSQKEFLSLFICIECCC